MARATPLVLEEGIISPPATYMIETRDIMSISGTTTMSESPRVALAVASSFPPPAVVDDAVKYKPQRLSFPL